MWGRDSMYAVNETRLVEELPLDVKDTSSLITNRVERRNAQVQRVGVRAAGALVRDGGGNNTPVVQVGHRHALAAQRGRVALRLCIKAQCQFERGTRDGKSTHGERR